MTITAAMLEGLRRAGWTELAPTDATGSGEAGGSPEPGRSAAPPAVLRCSWPNCRHLDSSDPSTQVSVTDPDGDTWCLCHLGDDHLPVVTAGHSLRECARCGNTTSEATAEGVHLHSECRRIWAMAQDARPPMGAYQRKAGQ